MTNREKVIKGLEKCIQHVDRECPTDCPYFEQCIKYDESRVVFQPILRYALAAIKKQNECENCILAIEDRQPIVHCKNCKHQLRTGPNYLNNEAHYWCLLHQRWTTDNWSCANGERSLINE